MKNPLINLGLPIYNAKLRGNLHKHRRRGSERLCVFVCTSKSISNEGGRWRRKSFLKAYFNLVEHKCMQISAI